MYCTLRCIILEEVRVWNRTCTDFLNGVNTQKHPFNDCATSSLTTHSKSNRDKSPHRSSHDGCVCILYPVVANREECATAIDTCKWIENISEVLTPGIVVDPD